MRINEDKTKGQEPQKQAQPADISRFISALESSFEAVHSPKDVTHWFSTDDVVDAIKDINPGANVSREQVYHALLQEGFEYGAKPGTQGLQFRWMMRAKD